MCSALRPRAAELPHFSSFSGIRPIYVCPGINAGAEQRDFLNTKSLVIVLGPEIDAVTLLIEPIALFVLNGRNSLWRRGRKPLPEKNLNIS
jgi:hypothetical protein